MQQINTTYTARHTSIISVPAGNGQASRGPDSRETILSSNPDRRHLYYYIILFNISRESYDMTKRKIAEESLKR